ncbi:MAG: hypothetical protein KDA84_17945 [Planctomycetaceae bacterium]|nr:hypothetical protein [Planctomycetaceae bacterium]
MTKRPTSPLHTHPVFHTPITGESARRPAIQVDILDPSEGLFSDAELYLAVQSSRFPDNAWILLPINVGDFDGCRSRFVQLPFEVSPKDNLLFNLLDDDELTEEEELRIVASCRIAGYCVWVGGSVHAPVVARIAAPVSEEASEILGESVVGAMTMSKFDNYGQAEYIVPASLPEQPNEANRLSLLDDSKHVRIQLRIFGPPNPLDHNLTSHQALNAF